MRALHFIEPAPCASSCDSLNAYAPYYPTLGVVSGTNSHNTGAAASVFGVFNIPVVGGVSTSELLSDVVSITI